MSNQKKLVIGLFGFGVVGEGLYKVLQQSKSLEATIKRVCIKDPQKPRQAPAELFTTNKDELLLDDEINVIVEVIDDSKAAFEIVSTAVKNGKAVVSASKKMLAENLPAILALQKEYQTPFLYEAAACASIPVIRNLEEYYDNDLLHAVRAIVNGSTNFILTKMFEEQLDFADALALAQQLGFAESNPVLDVEGYDAVNKWCLHLIHAFGIVAHPTSILFSGIQNIQLTDALVAKEKQYEIKLVAQAIKLKNGNVAAFVLPQFVRKDDHLAFVKNEYNGVEIESGFADKQFFYGKGAGSFPTASAILSDISALRYGYRYEYKKLYYQQPDQLSSNVYLRVYLSYQAEQFVIKNDFELIEELHVNNDRKYLVGIILTEALLNNFWWKENGNSLILLPDAVVEDIEIVNKAKKPHELSVVE